MTGIKDINNGGNCEGAKGDGIYRNTLPVVQLSCEPKTTLRSNIYY